MCRIFDSKTKWGGAESGARNLEEFRGGPKFGVVCLCAVEFPLGSALYNMRSQRNCESWKNQWTIRGPFASRQKEVLLGVVSLANRDFQVFFFDFVVLTSFPSSAHSVFTF